MKLEGAEWINLVQDRDSFKTLANLAASCQFPLNEGSALAGSRTDSCGPKILVMGVYRLTLLSKIGGLQTKCTVPIGDRPILRVLQFLHCRKHLSALTKKFGQKFSVFIS